MAAPAAVPIRMVVLNVLRFFGARRSWLLFSFFLFLLALRCHFPVPPGSAVGPFGSFYRRAVLQVVGARRFWTKRVPASPANWVQPLQWRVCQSVEAPSWSKCCWNWVISLTASWPAAPGSSRKCRMPRGSGFASRFPAWFPRGRAGRISPVPPGR